MSEISVNKASQLQLNALEVELPHCIILSGKSGVGLRTIATDLAKKYDKTPLIISPDEKGSIKIDTVRRLYRLTSTKKRTHQFVLFDEADTLAPPAQNALLKLLEEPPDKTIFILTSHHPQALLPTIRSRAQEVIILPLSLTQTNALLDKKNVNDTIFRSQLLFMANGFPAELLRLIHDTDYFKAHSDAVLRARDFITANIYQKLIAIHTFGSNRDEALEHIRSTILIIQTSLYKKPSRELANMLKQLLRCEEKILADGNVRVQLLALAMNFKA